MAELAALPEPNVVVKPLPFEDDSAHVMPRSRPFRGLVGKLPLGGHIEFTPRGSSGLDETPIARVTVTEPPAFVGQYDISPPIHDWKEANRAGELTWYSWDDQDVIASVKRTVQYLIENRVKPLFEN